MKRLLVDEFGKVVYSWNCNCLEIYTKNLGCVCKQVFGEGAALKPPIIEEKKYESHVNDEIKKRKLWARTIN